MDTSKQVLGVTIPNSHRHVVHVIIHTIQAYGISKDYPTMMYTTA